MVAFCPILITPGIVHALPRITAAELQAHLHSDLLMGVQRHLESPVPQRRRRGMRVGEEMSRVLRPEKPLKFDYESIGSNYLFFTISLILSVDVELQEAAAKEAQEAKQAREEAQAVSTPLPPSAPLPAPAEGLKSFDLSDDLSDLQKCMLADPHSSHRHPVPEPKFIRQCLLGLRSQEPDQLAATMRALPRLIKQEPGDLPEVAQNLALALLHSGDEYKLKVPPLSLALHRISPLDRTLTPFAMRV